MQFQLLIWHLYDIIELKRKETRFQADKNKFKLCRTLQNYCKKKEENKNKNQSN